MTSLTTEAKARLMGYPYPLDWQGNTVYIYSKMVEDKEECIKAGYSETYLKEKYQSYLDQKLLIKANQVFFFDSDLCYECASKFHKKVRGVLQTKNSDGSITEQDVEYGFNYGVEVVPDGEVCQPAHLLEGNDFIVLNSPYYL